MCTLEVYTHHMKVYGVQEKQKNIQNIWKTYESCNQRVTSH
jgi:hypothetical protein